jgi:hypothetical protein
MATPPGGSFDDALKSASALEIESVGTAKTNPEIVAWSKAHVEIYRGIARVVQKAVRGEGDSADNPLERERGAADAPKK